MPRAAAPCRDALRCPSACQSASSSRFFKAVLPSTRWVYATWDNLYRGLSPMSRRDRGSKYTAVARDVLRIGLLVVWEASDRICGKRLRVVGPVLHEALARSSR